MKWSFASLLLLVVGCNACPERVVIREGMYQTAAPLIKDQKDWSEKLTIDPATGKDHRDELPQLTVEQKKQSDLLHEEYENLVREDRSK